MWSTELYLLQLVDILVARHHKNQNWSDVRSVFQFFCFIHDINVCFITKFDIFGGSNLHRYDENFGCRCVKSRVWFLFCYIREQFIRLLYGVNLSLIYQYVVISFWEHSRMVNFVKPGRLRSENESAKNRNKKVFTNFVNRLIAEK